MQIDAHSRNEVADVVCGRRGGVVPLFKTKKQKTTSLCDSMVVRWRRDIIMEIVMLSCFRTVGWRDRHAVARAWRQK